MFRKKPFRKRWTSTSDNTFKLFARALVNAGAFFWLSDLPATLLGLQTQSGDSWTGPVGFETESRGLWPHPVSAI
jgi:hypothetical protein